MACAEECPLSGVKRTWPIAVQMCAYDPKRTSAGRSMAFLPFTWIPRLGYFPRAMSAPGQRQRPTFHIVSDYKRISPDDVLRLIQEREARERADTRTEAQRWLGDPPPDRSALAQRKQT